MKKSKITHEYLLSRLSYCQVTGIFRWKSNNEINLNFRGKIAGSRCDNGIIIQINGEKWTASRLAVFHVTGIMPKTRVGHINGNPLDLRYSNLIILGDK